MNRVLVALAGVLLLTACSTKAELAPWPAPATTYPLTVDFCELVSNPARYHRTYVKVTGAITASEEFYAFLPEGPCDTRLTSPSPDASAWPREIVVEGIHMFLPRRDYDRWRALSGQTKTVAGHFFAKARYNDRGELVEYGEYGPHDQSLLVIERVY